MFGLSPTKILFTVAVIAIVWFGFKAMDRLNKKPKPVQKRAKDRVKAETAEDGVEDMVACPTCGDYVLKKKAPDCGRQGCPYG
ncbi:MAG: hypothetical protein ACPGO3_05685 [Magnetospiraceae bacterium]